jgi:hypothetical protein
VAAIRRFDQGGNHQKHRRKEQLMSKIYVKSNLFNL